MISSLYNPIVKHLVKLRQNHDYREDKGSVLVCGTTLVKELSNQFKPKLIMTPEEVSPQVLKKITGLQTFEGLIAEFSLPKPRPLETLQWILVFDGISDPGNLGTLLRTALAFGWEGVYFLDHTVDPYNDKAIRSSRGALFHLPYACGTFDEFKKLAQQKKLPILVGDTQGAPLPECHPKKGAFLVVGNEALGPREEMHALGKAITIPMTKEVESLNVGVAGAILLYHLMPKER